MVGFRQFLLGYRSSFTIKIIYVNITITALIQIVVQKLYSKRYRNCNY